MNPETLTSKGGEALAAEPLQDYILAAIEHRWNTGFFRIHGAIGVGHGDVGDLIHEVRRLRAKDKEVDEYQLKEMKDLEGGYDRLEDEILVLQKELDQHKDRNL